MKKSLMPLITALLLLFLILLLVLLQKVNPPGFKTSESQVPMMAGESMVRKGMDKKTSLTAVDGPLVNLDVRKASNLPLQETRAKGVERLKRQIPGVRVDFDPVTQAPKWIGSTAVLLTGPQEALAAQDADAPIRAFIDVHREVFGHGSEALDKARRVTDYSTQRGPSRKVVWHQQHEGIDVFEAVLQANLTTKSELINIGSQFVVPPEQAVQGLTSPVLAVEQAVALAGQNVGETMSAAGVRAMGPPAAQPDRRQTFRAAMLTDAEAKLTWLPMNESSLRLAWEVTLTSRSRAEMYRVLVDAENGVVLLRHALTEQISDATYRVYTTDSPTPMSPGHNTPSSFQPAEVTRSLVTTPALNTSASPNGWINDGVNITSGNNADGYTDTNSDNAPDLPRTTGTPNRVFDFPMDTTQDPASYKDASVTQIFYWTNFMHDRMYELGFTESAGNFQVDNFGRGGVGNDPVNAEALDGSGTNNANFSTPTDGGRGRMQMYVWTSMAPDRDSTFDTTVLFHEYGHGVSNRLVGGPSITMSALTSRGMGEGWSDFYGMTLLTDAAENPHGNWPAAGYLTLLRSGWLSENYYYGLRRYSYSTDMLKNPLTFKDIDPTQIDLHPSVPLNPTYGSTQDATQVHYQGTVWATILNELRAHLMIKHGNLAGNERAMFLVTEGMKYGPANPNFIQSRDGILQATLVNHPGDMGEVWTAFAKRGMGDGATSPDSSTTTGILEQYDVPDSLELNDRSGWNIQGNKGGPFLPATKTLTLSNDGVATIQWSSHPNASWLSVSPASGSLAPGANVTVTVTTQANAVAPGDHSTNLVFTNVGTSFNQPIGVRLSVTPPVAVSFDLSANPGWSTSGEWAYGTPSGSGGSSVGGAGNGDPSGGATGSSVFGVNLSGNAATAVGGPFYLTSTPVDLSARKTTRLRFKRWLNSNVLSSTRATVEVSTDGTTWREVFVNPGTAITDNAWQTMEYDISSMADQQPAVQVRWSYRNLVAGSAYSGWNIDDVEFLGESTAEFSIAAAATKSEADAPFTATLNLNLPQDADVTVNLSSSHPEAATVPATLTLLAGETSKTFTITPVDDALLDGTQTTVITASSTANIASGSHTLAVTDSETAVLTLTAPASVTEGSSVISGSLSVSAAPSQNVTVQLSAASSRLVVPASVVIPAGSTGPVSFAFDAADNPLAEGPQNVVLTASVPNWTPGTATVTVTDDETPTILLTGPAVAREGDGPQTYTVTVNTVQAVNRMLGLSSSDTSELTVPSSVVIPAGQFSANFDAIPQDDTGFDGTQNATLTASHSGYPNATRVVSIADNEVSAYSFAPIASPQKRNKPFDIAITARDINGVAITNHSGSVTLTAAAAGGPPPFTPSTVSGFINGIASIPVTVTATASGMTLTATGPGGKTGVSNAFNVEPVPHDTFVFMSMPTSATANSYFTAAATAVDDQGGVVTSYTGSTVVDLLASYFDRTVGSTSTTAGTDKIHNTAAQESRCQIIYTAAELGGVPKLISALSLYRLTTGGQPMVNYRIRLKHTTLAHFDGRSWEEDGWTTAYTSDSFSASGSFHTFNLKPFPYDGVRNLMVDISFDNASSSTVGTVRQTPAATNRMLSGTSNGSHGNPLTWTASTGPVPVISNELPTMQFNEARSFGPIPASPVAFTAGVWSGQAMAPAGANTWLRATAPSGVTGFSNLVTISNPSTTVGTESVFTDGFEAGTLGASWSTTANSGFNPRTLVTAANIPKTGTYHLTMDTTSVATGSFAANRPTLTLNLAGRKNVSLEWFAKSFLDESHAPSLSGPLGTFGSTTNYDGVSISQDGVTWAEVSALRSLSSSYGTTATRVFLDPVIQRLGWSFNSTFRLRFSQYDDQAIANDGIGIDEVAVKANPASSILVELPPTLTEGTLNVPVTVSLPSAAASNTTVTLTSNGPARLSIVSPVTVLAGQTTASTTLSAPQNQFADVARGIVITASASGQTTSYTHILVVDDEQPVLTMVLPASVTEGGSNGTGTVFIEPVQPVSTHVYLTSGNPAEATVTAFVAIGAGSRSANFTLTPVNDVRLDGTQTVTLTASGQGLASSSSSLDVLDNENTQLTVTPPALLNEGGAPGVGTVRLSGTRLVDTVVTLTSSDTTEASVPANATIPGGQVSANFQVFPVEDVVQDGMQNVTVTAAAAGLTDGTASFGVADNDPAAFEFAIVPSPQTRNAPFNVTITARDGTDNVLTGFHGTVNLSAISGSGALAISPAVSGTFIQGVWTGSLSIGDVGTGVTLNATGTDGATGTSDAFDVNPGGAAVALAFVPISSPQIAGSLIPVQVSAVDADGIHVNEAVGSVTVNLVTFPGGLLVGAQTLTLVNGLANTSLVVPAGLAAVRLEGSMGALTGQSAVFSVQGLSGAAETIFEDGFESGNLRSEWTVSGTGTYRTQVTTANVPRSGAYHLTMDSTTDSSDARNEATLTLNLSGKTGVALVFWMKEFSDEDHGPPTTPFSGGADFDGVAISADGSTWYEVQGLRTVNGISGSYTQFLVDLSSAAAAHGLTLGAGFKIRFNQYDNYTVSTDGFAFDDVSVVADYFQQPEPVVTLFADDFETGVFKPQWQITGTGNHRTEITSAQTPRGSYHLLMDVHATGDSRNEATLTLDVSGYQDRILKFWMKENSDEDHAPLTNPFTGGQNFDGVAISTDGTTWHEVQPLRGADSTNAYREFTIDLDAAASAAGLIPGVDFRIRFNHFDNSTWVGGDGFAFDDITLTGQPLQQLVLNVPNSLPEGGSVSATVGLPFVRSVDTVIALSSNRPGSLALPASITIPAGSTVSAAFTLTVAQDAFLTGNLVTRVIAFADGYRRRVVETVIADNDLPEDFQLALPATLAEGGSVNGTISMTTAGPFDLPVALSAAPALGLTFPDFVTFPAGSTSVSFNFAKPENDIMLEPASTTVTGTLAGANASATVALTDNETSSPLVITLPASVLESAVPVSGSVGFPPPVTSAVAITVNLTSSDESELTVPTTVTIPAGAGSVSFDATPVDDSLNDGSVTVTLSAAAAGLPGDTHEIIVADDEVHHLAFDPISSPQSVPGVFSVTVRAQSIDNQPVPNFTATAALSAANAGGVVSLTPATTGAFVSGVWTGQLAIQAPANAVTLTASAPGGLTGTSNVFDVVIGPSLTVTPATVNVTTLQGEPPVIQPISLSNPGVATLQWNAEVMMSGLVEQPPLAQVLADLNTRFATLTALIPNRYNFSDGITGTNISDGGGDMYDGGNYLGTNLTTASTYLSYSDNVITPSANLGVGGQYFTRKHPGLFVFAADIASLNHFEITGDLGADGGGSTDTSVLSSTRGATTYKGFVKRVYNAGDPSVNHLIIVKDDPALARTASADTNSDQHRLSGLNGVTRVYYLLYASSSGGYINDTQTQAIMDAFLDTLLQPSWLTLSQASGSITGGGNTSIQAAFDPTGLPQGVHNATLRFTSNDLAAPQQDIPVVFTVGAGVHHFEWNPIPSPQVANVPFAATITAKDNGGNTLTGFNGSADLAFLGVQTETTSGAETWQHSFPFWGNSYTEYRTQCLYLPSEVGPPGRIDAIALYVNNAQGAYNNLTVRFKHTTKASYSGSGEAVWEASGWTTSYQANLAATSAGGWLTLPLTVPFHYDGTQNLMVDVSYDNTSTVTSSATRATSKSIRTLHAGTTGNSSGSPVTWSGATPAASTSNSLTNIRFTSRPYTYATPPQVSFTSGVWTGNLAAQSSGTSFAASATHPTQDSVTGASNTFDVTSVGSLSLSIPATGTEGDTLNATVTASVAPASDLTVALNSTDTSAALSPSTVTLLAGQTNAVFTLTLPDDALLDGPQSALISASAPAYDLGQTRVRVNDNETTTVALTLPATLAEGTSSTVGQASVQLATAAASDLTISLGSSLTSRLTVPTFVTIPSGQSNAAFVITAPNNFVIDGDQEAIITATLDGSPPATGAVQVTDNESRALSITLFTSSLSEGGLPVTSAGYVSLSGSVTSPLTINLTSSDTSELNVTSTVTVAAGSSSSNYFTLTPVNDSDFDGTQTVTLSASTSTFTDATRTINVLDDDVSHFTLSTLPSSQIRNAPFNVTFTAKDINNVTISTYAGSPVLSAADGATPLAVTPGVVTGFSGGSRTQSVTVADFATNAVLTLTDPVTGGSGVSTAFAVVTGDLDHFGFSALPSSIELDSQVPVTITAQDAGNNTIASFNQTAALSISGDSSLVTVGTSTSTWSIPLGSQSRSQRMQVIYLPSEVGAARMLHNLALYVGTVPGSSFTGYTIRMKHTSATTASASWDNTGWTTVYQADTTISNTGWHQFNFTTPFAYDGTSSLMVDFSYHNAAAGVTQGYTRYTSSSTSRTTLIETPTDYGNPLTWSGASNPTPVTNTVVPNVRFGTVAVHVPVTPTVTGAFTSGVWSGTFAASSPATGVRLRAVNALTSGASNTFNVLSPPSVLISLPATAGESVGSVSGTVTLPVVKATDTTVSLASNDLTEVIPATPTVVIPAGMISAEFTLTILDDTLQDGDQVVSITASSPGLTNGSANLVVLDNDPHHFAIGAISEQQKNVPFNLTLTAQNAANATLTGFTGTVSLSAAAGGGDSVTVLPASSGAFVNGVWTGPVTVTNGAFSVFLTATGPAGSTGVSNTFNVTGGPATRLAWTSQPTHVVRGAPFPVTLTALDADGGPGFFTGTANLSVVSPESSTTTIGAGLFTSSFALYTAQSDSRAQIIYKRSEVGPARRLTGIALNISSSSTFVYNNFTLRLKHTPLQNFNVSPVWESSGWTQVWQGTYVFSATGWVVFTFTTPFEYNGVDNLMVDISTDNSSLGQGAFLRRDPTGYDVGMIHYYSQTSGAPTSWSGTSVTRFGEINRPQIRLVSDPALSVTPTITGAFVNGQWTGNLTFNTTHPSVVLHAAGTAASGTSLPFMSGFPAPVFSAEPAFTRGTSNTLAWSVSSGAGNYTLERDILPTFSSPVITQAIGGTSTAQTGLADGATYHYRVRSQASSDTLASYGEWRQTSFSDFASATPSSTSTSLSLHDVTLASTTSTPVTWTESFDAAGSSWADTLFSVVSGGTTMDRQAMTVGPNTTPELPVNQGGDLEGRMGNASGAGSSFGLMPAIADFTFADGSIEGYLAPEDITGYFYGSLLLRSSQSATGGIQGYAAFASFNTTSVTFSIQVLLNGVLNQLGTASLSTPYTSSDNIKLRLSAQGATLNLQAWKVSLSGGSVIETPLMVDGVSTSMVRTDTTFSTGRPSLYFSAAAGRCYFDDITVTKNTPVFATAGSVVSPLISPPYRRQWGALTYSLDTASPGTTGSVDVLDANGNVLAAGVPSGTNLSALPAAASQTALRFRTNLATSNSANTPYLRDWALDYLISPAARVFSPWSNAVSSVQDASPPVVSALSFTTPNASAALTGTASDAISGIGNVTVSGLNATSSNAFATWSRSLTGLVDGSNSITVTAADKAVPANTTSILTTVFRIANPNADPDKNGLPTLLDHALGVPAGTTNLRNVLPSVLTQTDLDTGEHFFQFQYRRRIQHAGLDYHVDMSSDMNNWDQTGISVVEMAVLSNGDGVTETVTVRVIPAIHLRKSVFLRLRVTFH